MHQSTRSHCSAASMMKSVIMSLLLVVATVLTGTTAKVIDFESAGASPNDDSWDTVLKNGALLNSTLNSLQPGDELVVPGSKTYFLMGGIVAKDLASVVIRIDGTLTFASTTLNMVRH